MSPLLPTNLSNHSKERRKPERPNTWSPWDHPEFVWEGMPNNAPVTGDRIQANYNQRTNDETYRKARAVPVVMVNPDPLQMMEPDEHGAELGKEARVWKVYVKETDRWDAELAALLSAVSTTFLIESSRKLQQDPNDISAMALLGISQALVAMASNTPVEIPSFVSSKFQSTSSFGPSRNAIVVNTLWYLSLSLSIATSLLAMLAKDWCHSFAADRTGHPWDHALKRQRKWVMIERWKVREFIAVLHLGVYLARVIECILEAHDFRNYAYDVLSHRITFHLRGVPSHLRGLSSLSGVITPPRSTHQAPSAGLDFAQSSIVRCNGTTTISQLASPPLSTAPEPI
ncbi:hypothetical protein RSAG8_12676, partial [Rhizoctonia solani AG-8 WAC10335]